MPIIRHRRLANTNKKDTYGKPILFYRSFGEMDRLLLFKSSNGLKGKTLASERNSCSSERNIATPILHGVIRGLNTFSVEYSGNQRSSQIPENNKMRFVNVCGVGK